MYVNLVPGDTQRPACTAVECKQWATNLYPMFDANLLGGNMVPIMREEQPGRGRPLLQCLESGVCGGQSGKCLQMDGCWPGLCWRLLCPCCHCTRDSDSIASTVLELKGIESSYLRRASARHSWVCIIET